MATQAQPLPTNPRIKWCGVCWDRGVLTLSTETVACDNGPERLCLPCYDRLRNLSDTIPPGELEALSWGMWP